MAAIDASPDIRRKQQIALIDIIEQTERRESELPLFDWPTENTDLLESSARLHKAIQKTHEEINLTLESLGGLACSIDLNGSGYERPCTLLAWLGGQAGKIEWTIRELPQAQVTLDRSVIAELRANHALE